MTPLPAALGGTELVAWRLDRERHARTWDSGEGASLEGGRWNTKGVPAVYCSLDPATTILEAAVHRGFKVLDTEPHVLTAVTITEPANVHIITPEMVPNPNWLRSGDPSAGQQDFGNTLLATHKFIVIPSAASTHSWNLIFVAANAAGAYTHKQHRFGLDPRLHPPAA